MTILVPTDFSDSSRAAIRTAVAEARARDSSVRLLHCLAELDADSESLLGSPPDDLRATARDRLEETFQEVAGEEARPIVDYSIYEGRTVEGIREHASSEEIELVAQGATGSGALSRLLLGSTAEETVRVCDVPVLTVPSDGALETVDSILAPIDLSTCSRASLRAATDWARRHDAELLVQHSTTLPTGAMTAMEWEPDDDDRTELRNVRSDQLKEFLDDIDLEGIDVDVTLDFDEPARNIVRTAEEQEIDMVAMGTHGRRGFERLFLGSTTTNVLRHIPCAMLTVRHRE